MVVYEPAVEGIKSVVLKALPVGKPNPPYKTPSIENWAVPATNVAFEIVKLAKSVVFNNKPPAVVTAEPTNLTTGIGAPPAKKKLQ